MGAHDLDALAGEIAIRFSRKGDAFTPLGEELVEVLDRESYTVEKIGVLLFSNEVGWAIETLRKIIDRGEQEKYNHIRDAVK